MQSAMGTRESLAIDLAAARTPRPRPTAAATPGTQHLTDALKREQRCQSKIKNNSPCYGFELVAARRLG